VVVGGEDYDLVAMSAPELSEQFDGAKAGAIVGGEIPGKSGDRVKGSVDFDMAVVAVARVQEPGGSGLQRNSAVAEGVAEERDEEDWG